MGARLRTMLRRRGVDAATAEDVAQETAVRALRYRITFVDADDLFRWAAVVAWRAAIDARRKTSRLDVGTIPERESSQNVAAAVEDRSALEAVSRGLRAMSEADRRAILGPLRSEHRSGDRAQAAAAAVRRHRARSRLLAATKGFLGVLGWLAVRRREGVSRPAAAAAAATPVLIVALTLVPQMDAGADDARRAPRQGAEPSSVPAPSPPPAVPTAPAPAVAVTGDMAPAASAATATTTTPRAAAPLPPFRVEVADPAGRTEVRGRPNEPDDKIVCIEVEEIGGERACVDATVDSPVDAGVDAPVDAL